MIEMGEHDFVARTKLTSDGAAHGVGERRHVWAEDDFIRIAAQKICHGSAGFIDNSICAAAGGIGATGVGVRLRQIIADGVNDALWNLCAAGAVEKDGGVAVYGLGQGRKLRSDPG